MSRRTSRTTTLSLMIVLVFILSNAATTRALPSSSPSSWRPFGGWWSSSKNNNNNNNYDDYQGDNNDFSTSMLTIDPSKLLSILIKHGGLLFPESCKNDLQVVAKCCRVDQVQLNIVQRKLVVHNFTVNLPNTKDDGDNKDHDNVSFRIDRIYFYWDSYLRPCVDIEVENVYVLVEFVNILLTENNWDELKRNGFPPYFPEESLSSSLSFLRIGSIQLSGTITACLKSRPLQNDLGTFQLELAKFGPLEREIRNQSLENLAALGRRGCTLDEVYTLIREYFGGVLRQAIANIVEDFAKNGENTMEGINQAVMLAKKSIKQYVDDAQDWTEEKVKNTLAKRLDDWGASLAGVKKRNSNPKKESIIIKFTRTIQKFNANDE